MKSQILLAFALAAALSGQTPGPIRIIDFHTVQPARYEDYRAASKASVALLKKADWDKSRLVFRSIGGPSRIAVVRTFGTYSEIPRLGAPMRAKLAAVREEFSALARKEQECLSATETAVQRLLPEFVSQSAVPAPFYRTVRFQVKPERVDDFMALMRSEYLPAIKKAGYASFVLAQNQLGGSPTEYVMSGGFSKASDLDAPESPLQRAMGAEGYAKFVARLRPMLAGVEYNLYAYEPELSYVAPAAVTTSSR